MEGELHWETKYEPLLSKLYTEEEKKKLGWLIDQLFKGKDLKELKDKVLEFTKD